MHQFIRFILICISLGLSLVPLCAQEQIEVNCGDWVTVKAEPKEGYQFEYWSDGSTDQLYRFQVNDDVRLMAFFSRICEEHEDWPVVALYDWLIMLNVKYINDTLGYYFSKNQVTWYQVNGEPDDLGGDPTEWDDVPVVKGSYYLTLDQDLTGSGDYYARVNVSATSSGQKCSGYIRSMLVSYVSSYGGNQSAPRKGPRLMPSVTHTGGTIRLTDLVPTEQSVITIYDPNGRRLSVQESEGEHTILLDTDYMPGCYLVKVDSPSGHYSLKFIISR